MHVLRESVVICSRVREVSKDPGRMEGKFREDVLMVVSVP